MIKERRLWKIVRRKLKIYIAVIFILIISVSFIIWYAGHFSYKEQQPEADTTVKPPVETAEQTSTSAHHEFPVVFKHIPTVIDGRPEEINILEIDTSDPDVKVLPMLSHNLIYGFENLSAMVARNQAYAAINGGFFYEYGLPSGMVAIDGRLLSASSGKYPVFMVSAGKASLSEVKSELWLVYDGGRLKIDKLNAPAGKGESVVYTPVYGSSSRLKTENLTVTVKNNIITDEGFYHDEVNIPDNGMLISFILPSDYSPENLPFKRGDTVHLEHVPALPADIQAYECGSWIVKGGKVVIGETDPWVGVMTNNDPRTAIGIKKDGKVVFFTVDGRQPGYSAGMTGREMGEFFLNYGIVDAAMLDGGASTEMIVDGKIVNRPSFKGQERPVGGGLAVVLPADVIP